MIEQPYLLFLGDAPDALAAKVAQGIRDWRPELAIGQYRLDGCRADLGLPDMTPPQAAAAGARGATVTCYQSNHEGALIDFLHERRKLADGIIINAGAYTHTSVALHDAIEAIQVPVVEVHISNTHAREGFRHVSRIAPACLGQVTGLGRDSYTLAANLLLDHLGARPR